MASGDESSRYIRHERDGDCTEDDGESGSHSGSPVSGGDDEDGEYYYEYGDAGGGSDYGDISDAEDTKVEAAAPRTYVVLTEDEVLRRQAEDTAKVAEVLSIPPAFAAFLLRRYRWVASSLQDAWFSDERRVREASGLPADGRVPVATALSASPLACAICFDTFPAGGTRSAGCAHYYCDECWRGYVRAAVGDGARCLSLRCPDPGCSAAVVRDLVEAVAGGGDDDDSRERYARFALRSYVEESGGRIKWCPGPGCAHAVEFVGCAGDDDAADVLCRCRHGFCWRCGEEAHRPVSCGTVRAWLAKNKSDSETANWVLANTKHCPKCRRAIEKNQGCNHISCPPPCGHHFCWLCFKPAGTREHYACDIYTPPPEAGGEAETKEEATARQARASLDRYLFHYERWAGNLRSLEKARQDMDELERPSVLEGMAAAVGLSAATELGFMVEAYEQIVHGRRVLRWSHAYGYYLDPARDGKKRELFDYLQGEANAALERLHKLAEVDRNEVFCYSEAGDSEADDAAADDDVAKRFRDYRDTMVNFTVATRTFMGNLVKAFETDLCEVYAVNF